MKMSIIYQLLHGLVKWWSLVKCVSIVNPEDGFEFSDELLLWAGQRANTRIAIQSGTWWVGIDGVPYQLVVTLTACYHVEICWSLNRMNRIVLYCAHRLYISLMDRCGTHADSSVVMAWIFSTTWALHQLPQESAGVRLTGHSWWIG